MQCRTLYILDAPAVLSAECTDSSYNTRTVHSETFATIIMYDIRTLLLDGSPIVAAIRRIIRGRATLSCA